MTEETWQKAPKSRQTEVILIQIFHEIKITAYVRSCTPSLTFCISHIARYVPETAKPNLAHICGPALTIFFECGLRF